MYWVTRTFYPGDTIFVSVGREIGLTVVKKIWKGINVGRNTTNIKNVTKKEIEMDELFTKMQSRQRKEIRDHVKSFSTFCIFYEVLSLDRQEAGR
jgi:hypothetical protein